MGRLVHTKRRRTQKIKEIHVTEKNTVWSEPARGGEVSRDATEKKGVNGRETRNYDRKKSLLNKETNTILSNKPRNALWGESC